MQGWNMWIVYKILLYSIFIVMINLKTKSYAISSVSGFWTWEDMKFKLSYIAKVPNPEKTRTDKDWNVRPQFDEVVKYQFVDLWDLWEKFKGKTKNEICQGLVWKTLSFNTILDL